MPIAVAPIDWQMRTVCGKLFSKCSDQRAILVINRAATAQMVVMLGNFQHPFPRHVPATQHVLQKRQHVVGLIRTAKRNDE